MTIYEIEVKDPKKAIVKHWHSVPWLAEAKKIKFKPGINVIFGPNGSGKSTLIHALAMMKHCKDSGMPVVTRDSIRDFSEGVMSDGYRDGVVMRCDDEVARYVSPELTLGRWGGNSIDDDFGMEQITQILSQRSKGRASSGERMMQEIARIAFARPSQVDYRVKRDRINCPKLYDIAVKALKGSTRKGQTKQVVLLFDEVERSMDFVNEALWWEKIEQARKTGTIQIILATHSPFALALDESQVNFIETSPGYVENARKAMNDFGWVRK